MSCPRVFCCWLLLAAALGMAGCIPGSENRGDEQRDPHYVRGRARVTSGDHEGAVEQFEKAIENFPRHSSAHLELGILHERHRKDYASAVFHYERHLRYRPDSEYRDRVQERIKACKIELAREVILDPVTQEMQRDIDRLHSDNVILRRQIESLQTQLTGQAARFQAERQQAPPPEALPQGTAPQQPPQQPARAQVPSGGPAGVRTPAARRQYTVQAGDTMATIARNHGVPLNRLLEVNPDIDPRRLQIGHSVMIPAP